MLKDWRTMKDALRKSALVKPFIILGMTAGLIVSTYTVYETSDKLKKASVLDGGVQTCFGRVNQTYTAKMLGDQFSPYLESSFTNITEECLSDVISSYEDNLALDLDSIANKINGLATDVHWFHEKILDNNSMSSVGEVQINSFGPRFQKIENQKDVISATISGFKRDLTESLSGLKVSFYALACLLPLFLLWEYLEKRSVRAKNNEIEQDALAEISSDDFTTEGKVTEIIKSALDHNELVYCSKLFTRYQSDMTEKIIHKANGIEVIKNGTKEEVKGQIDRIWNENEDAISAESLNGKIAEGLSCSLGSVANKVIDHLSNKLLAEGVFIEFNNEDDLNIQGSEEVIEQIIYQSVLFSLKTAREGESAKKVVINTRELGGMTTMDILAQNSFFNKDFLFNEKGLPTENSDRPLSIQILDELLQEVKGKVDYDNIKSKDEISGARLKLTFHGSRKVTSQEENANSSSRLVNITKGTKRELLERMKSEA